MMYVVYLLHKRYLFSDIPVIAEMVFWKGGGDY
jgi:hypothetical protein